MFKNLTVSKVYKILIVTDKSRKLLMEKKKTKLKKSLSECIMSGNLETPQTILLQYKCSSQIR